MSGVNPDPRQGRAAQSGIDPDPRQGRAAHGGQPAPGDLQEMPVPELLKQLSDQTATLVRQEMELAKAELTVKGKRMGIGAGAFGGAGVVGLFALGALTAAIILALDIVVAGWLAAVITAALYGLVAGVLALFGKRKVGQGAPPVPEQTIDSVKEDVRWTKNRAQQGQT